MRKKEFDEYSPEHLDRLKKALVDIYGGLGRISENLYLVGGMVPDLLVRNKLPYLRGYLGTLDIDIAIKFAVNSKHKFDDFYDRLRLIGFEKQKTNSGKEAASHSFIKYEGGFKPVVLDLLIDDKFPPKADKLKEIAPNIDAVKFKGVYLVFDDFLAREVSVGSKEPIEIKIPNIIPFLTLKAFAYMDIDSRTAKDAFDIWYTVVNFREGPDSVRKERLKYKKNADVKNAFNALRELFNDETSAGTRDVSFILTSRYGLEMALANREVIFPMRKL